MLSRARDWRGCTWGFCESEGGNTVRLPVTRHNLIIFILLLIRFHFGAITRLLICISGACTYSDQDAVQVPGLVAVFVPGAVLLQQLREAPHAGHPQDVNAVVAAESLQQGEVDLQRNVTFILLISGEDAQDDTVRVSAGGRGGGRVNVNIFIVKHRFTAKYK